MQIAMVALCSIEGRLDTFTRTFAVLVMIFYIERASTFACKSKHISMLHHSDKQN